MASRSPWPLAAKDGSVTLYELINLVGNPILAVKIRDLVRIERELKADYRVSPERLAKTLKSAEVFAIYNPQRKMLRFADKAAVRKRLAEDVADRNARRAAAAAQNEDGPVIRTDASTSRATTPTPAPQAEPTKRTAGKKRTASTVGVQVPPQVASSIRSDAAAPSLAATGSSTLGSTSPPAQPPTKRIRPPLLRPAHSSPAAFGAVTAPPALQPERALTNRPASPALGAAPPAPTSTFADAEKIAVAKHVAGRAFELETLRLAHEAAVRTGAGAFLALDVEAWEFDHDLLLEFGWSILEYVKDETTGKVTERRETQHVGACDFAEGTGFTLVRTLTEGRVPQSSRRMRGDETANLPQTREM